MQRRFVQGHHRCIAACCCRGGTTSIRSSSVTITTGTDHARLNLGSPVFWRDFYVEKITGCQPSSPSSTSLKEDFLLGEHNKNAAASPSIATGYFEWFSTASVAALAIADHVKKMNLMMASTPPTPHGCGNEFLQGLRRKRILHVGCGTSTLGLHLAQQLGCGVTNVDCVPEVIEYMKKTTTTTIATIQQQQQEWVVADMMSPCPWAQQPSPPWAQQLSPPPLNSTHQSLHLGRGPNSDDHDDSHNVSSSRGSVVNDGVSWEGQFLAVCDKGLLDVAQRREEGSAVRQLLLNYQRCVEKPGTSSCAPMCSRGEGSSRGGAIFLISEEPPEERLALLQKHLPSFRCSYQLLKGEEDGDYEYFLYICSPTQ